MRQLQLRPLRCLRLLRYGFLCCYARLELIIEGVGLRLPLPDEPAVGLHLSLILDGIQDDPLLRHLLGLGDGELRLHLRHVRDQSMDLWVVLLHGLRTSSSSSSISGEFGGRPATMRVARRA
ncbi:hypothetical protein D1007_30748 [Hordeum vulgare]|nr:hypothetical protein D1007_30748 [Hordeum vulgare]